MKIPLFLLLSTVAAHAASFPELQNTNTAGVGMGPPPMSAQQAADEAILPPGFQMSVFAAEPDVQNPIQLTWDTHGRLWVAENYTMDSDRFVDDYRDRIVILDGADGGSRFTERRVFTDDIQHLMGFAIGYGGVWVMASPNILFIPDRDADGVPDGPAEIVYDGFSYTGGNMHTSANGLEFGIDGWIYGRTGHAHVQLIGPPGTPTAERTRLHGSIFRFNPVTRAFEALSSGTVNPFGQDWDKYGEHFFDSTIVGHLWYQIPGAKYVSSSAEPNLKAYELLDTIADHRFGNRGGGGGGRGGAAAPARGGFGGGRGGAAGPGAAGPGRGDGAPVAANDGARGGGGGRGGTGDTPADSDTPNGHAVVGMMIYQGDNWPESYRDKIYLLNLFAHRINVEDLERQGSGFVASRAEEPDIVQLSDSWFRGIDISYGPDGGVFITDWTDTGDYHNRTGENRLSGRVYKLTYGNAEPSQGSDLTTYSIEQLVALNTHANEWFPRQARVELSNRLVNGQGIGNAIALLRAQFASETNVVNKLRALWTLHTIGGTDEAFLLPLLRSSDEHLRVWGIRLLANAWPLDALHTTDPQPSGASTYIQQRPSAAVSGGSTAVPSAVVRAELNRMAVEDPSSLVRLVLSSTMQRLPYAARPALASGLVSHAEDADDTNLPLMNWWGLIPLADSDPAALAGLVANNELPTTRRLITRRLAEDIGTSPDPINQIIAASYGKPEAFQADIIEGLSLGLQGQRGVALPPDWDALSEQVHESANADLVAQVRAIDVILGSTRALAEARQTALSASAATSDRVEALQSLLDSGAPTLREVASQLLAVPSVNAVAATALATFNDPAIAPQLIAAYPQFDAADRPRLMAALTARPSSAQALLNAVADGRIPRTAISANDARQIRNLNDPAVAQRLAEVWGEIRETPEAKQQLAESYLAELTAPPGGRGGRGGRGAFGNPDPLAQADLSQGRLVFVNTCAVCHTLFGEGGQVGPDLTAGSRRHDLESLLAKIVDPSAELPNDSRFTIVQLNDGRTVSGMVMNRTSSTLTINAITETVSVPIADIQSTELANYSLMPEGLFAALTPEQRRDLVAYLGSDVQVPLPDTQ